MIQRNKLIERLDKREPLRLVLDTNVLLSVLVFRDARFAPLERAWSQGQVQILGDEPVYEELLRVSRYPQFASRTAPDLIAFRARLEWVVGEGPRALPLCRDPDDQKFLELAARGAADGLITGDRALLRVARKGLPFAVVAPATLLRVLGAGYS